MTLVDQLRQAVTRSGLTLYRVSKDSGVSYPTLHRFVNGAENVYLSTADKLAAFFQMRLTRPIKPKGGERCER